RTHVFNLYGAYTFPFALNFGMSVKVQSGVPITKLGHNQPYGGDYEIPLEPRGASGRSPTTGDIGGHAEYPLRFGLPRLNVILDVFNILNSQRATDVDMASELGGIVNPDPSLRTSSCPSCANADFGKATEFQSPRQFRLAVRTLF